MKHRVILLMGVCLIVSTVFSQTGLSIIPAPVMIEKTEGVFEIGLTTKIVVTKQTRSLGIQLKGMLSPAIGYDLPIKETVQNIEGCIQLDKKSDLSPLGEEGYRLTVTPQSILIEAYADAGIFYGMQTLRQLLPVEIFQQKPAKDIQWRIPCVAIEDKPRFQWRGMHLDVCRHFMPKEFVKKYINLLAIHKMNTFHWHLTEDQGWRIEIKKYPKLTEIGAWRKETVIGRNSGTYDGKRHGGYYTQDDVREIVAYAKERYITVVPEIEMPGHCRSALAAYPELSCTGGPFEVKTNWGVEPEVYCAGNDDVLQFQKDILKEILALFPSEYIHIGGDECPKSRWEKCPKCQARIKAEGLKDEHELQSWFIKQIDTFLVERDRRLVGWDEILEGGLAPGATVMSWRGESGGIRAAKAGHDVVMAPNSHTYFDHYQAKSAKEPLAIGGFLPLEKVYFYNPIPDVLTNEQQRRILGVQAQIWSEYIPTDAHVEYMAYPRACALSEVAWTPKDKKEYNSFYDRLTTHLKRLDCLEVNYRPLDPPELVAATWKSGQISEAFHPMKWDVTPVLKEAGTYDVTFQYTGGAHRLDIQSVELLIGDKVIAKDKHFGITGGMTKDNTYTLNVKGHDKSTRYILCAVVRSDGGTDSNGNIYFTKQ